MYFCYATPEHLTDSSIGIQRPLFSVARAHHSEPIPVAVTLGLFLNLTFINTELHLPFSHLDHLVS